MVVAWRDHGGLHRIEEDEGARDRHIEQTKTALKDKPGVFTAASFVKHIRKIDVGASSM